MGSPAAPCAFGPTAPGNRPYENRATVGNLYRFLQVEPRIKPMFETLDQRRDSATRFNAETGHDPFRFDHGEFSPRHPIDLNCGLHTVLLVNGLKPETVMREPVFGIIDNDGDQLLFIQP